MENQFSAEVTGLNSHGQGVLRAPSGKVYFVWNVYPQDLVQVEITEEKKSFGYAKLLKIEKKSPARRESPCAYRPQCGGCPWIELNYDFQVESKKKRVEELRVVLESLQEKEIPLEDFTESKEELGYRNRAKLFLSEKNQFGFKQNQSSEVVAVKKCVVLNEQASTQLDHLSSQSFVAPKNFAFINAHREKYHLSNKESDVFCQANDKQNIRLKSHLREKLQLQTLSKNCFELFSGTGNFSQELSECYLKVHAYDSLPRKAVLQIDGVQHHSVNLYQRSQLNKIHRQAEKLSQFDLFLDPPRAGFPDLIEFLKLKKLKNIFYVSCSDSSLRADLQKLLKTKKFIVESMRGYDFFPQTPHVEFFVHLKRIDS